MSPHDAPLPPIRLGINVDHIATIRQARRCAEPDPVTAAALAELAGADQITVHLREDRRHIQDRDVRILRDTVRTALNLEMAVAEEMVAIALDVKPDQACLVPEKREEVTTEGGLDVRGGLARVKEVTARLRAAGIAVSLFIDAEPDQIAASAEAGATSVELHTGTYANARGAEKARALEVLVAGARQADDAGLAVHAGHGLDYWNVGPVVEIEELQEVNIGHAVIARAVLLGLEQAVSDMKALLER